MIKYVKIIKYQRFASLEFFFLGFRKVSTTAFPWGYSPREFWWGLLWAVHPPWMTSFLECWAGDSNPGPPYSSQVLFPLHGLCPTPILDHAPPLLDHAPPLLDHAPPLVDHAPPLTGPCPTPYWTMPHPLLDHAPPLTGPCPIPGKIDLKVN